MCCFFYILCCNLFPIILNFLQNTVCTREECKYIHSSKEDEDYFMETGSLPLYVLENAISKSVIPSLPSEAPVCKDYLSGECRRGKACRFVFISWSEKY